VAPPPGMISLTLKGNPTRKCPIFDGWQIHCTLPVWKAGGLTDQLNLWYCTPSGGSQSRPMHRMRVTTTLDFLREFI
jgi:hypothetical protein